MREILFRGKTKNELPSRWIYGSLTDVGHKWFIDDYETNARVITETIGQYTGLKDKNGTKIFEGDIVKLTRTNMYAPSTSFHNKDLVSLHRIYWNDDKHCFYQEHFDIEKKRVAGGGSLNFNDERAKQNIIEVIGNIYDNPELLKVEE